MSITADWPTTLLFACMLPSDSHSKCASPVIGGGCRHRDHAVADRIADTMDTGALLPGSIEDDTPDRRHDSRHCDPRNAVRALNVCVFA
jgi:hypothetical protein